MNSQPTISGRALTIAAGIYARSCLLLVICLMLATGCQTATTARTIEASGKMINEARPVSGFTAITVTGNAQLTVEQTGAESLTISADDNVVPLATSEVSNGRLILGMSPNVTLNNAHGPVFRVTVKTLTDLQIEGNVSAQVKSLQGDTLRVGQRGNAKAVLAGAVARLEVDADGNGQVMAENLQTRTATATVRGNAGAVLRVSESLDAQVSGNASIQYIGNPAITRKVSDNGMIRQR